MEEREAAPGPVLSTSNSTDSHVNEEELISSRDPQDPLISSSVPNPIAIPPQPSSATSSSVTKASSNRRIVLFQPSVSSDYESNNNDNESNKNETNNSYSSSHSQSHSQSSSSSKKNKGNEFLPTEIILLRREKKISIPIPMPLPAPHSSDSSSSSSLRIHRAYLSTKKYLHLYHEIIGGIYGMSSRPELELHHFEYDYHYNSSLPLASPSRIPSPPRQSTSTGSSVTTTISRQDLTPGNKLISVELVYDPILNLYVITNHIEDKLLIYLSQSTSIPSIQYLPLLSSVNRIGSNEYNTLNLEKQRQWRKFLRHFIHPLLADPERVEIAKSYLLRCIEIPGTEGYVTPEDSDGDDHSTTTDSDSDDEKGKKKKKRRGKKKGAAAGNTSKTTSGTTSKSSSKKAGAGTGAGTAKYSTKISKSKEK